MFKAYFEFLKMNIRIILFFSILLLGVLGNCSTAKSETALIISQDQNITRNNSQTSFIAEEITIFGNSILQLEIDKFLANYQGKRINYEDIYKLKQTITNLYTSNGYPNSGAYIPPQKITQGKVALEVIEGSIGEINVSGNKRLSDKYIISRIGKLQTPLAANDLLDRLYVLRQDPLIENVSAELSQGVSPGQSVLQIDVQESRAFGASLELGNQNSPAIGEFSRKANLNHGNLFGFGDDLSFSYTNTEGSNAITAGYKIPFNRRGTFTLGYGNADNDVVEDVFTPLDLESKSNFWLAGVDYDVISQSKHKFNLGLNFTRQHSETTVLDTPFAIALGADESGNTNISALRFAQTYTNRGEKSVLAMRSQLSFGVDVFDATISDDDDLPDGEFFTWLGQSQYVRNLSKDFPVVLRGDLQLSPSELVSLEQFRAGGANTVRGYRRDAVLADNALVLSAETRIPIFKLRSFNTLFQLVPFADFATLWNNDSDLELSTSTLASVGLGLNVNTFGDRLKARLEWGIPLTELDTDDQPVTFSLKYGF